MTGTRRALSVFAIVVLGAGVACSSSRPVAEAPSKLSADDPPAPEPYQEVPLSFEPNRGQFDGGVRFVARAGDYTVSLDRQGAVFGLPGSNGAGGAAIGMELIGAGPLRIAGLDRLPGVVNYFTPSTPGGLTDIETYAGVRYRSAYPGIDVVFRNSGGDLEYDFVLRPGADPEAIEMRFEGTEGMFLDPDGNLILETPTGRIVHQAPTIYEGLWSDRRPVDGSFVLERGRVGFAVPEHDPSLPLVIDPVVMAYSTFLGGTFEEIGYSVAVDGSGAAYVTGVTSASTDFPTTPGAYDEDWNGNYDVVVSKLSPGGDSLAYSTYIGGDGDEEAYSIALDSSGSAYLTGYTQDSTTDYPTTAGAHDTTPGGLDAFVTKLNPSGSALTYSTLLGGSGTEFGYGIAVDGTGAAYATGETQAAGFPTTSGAYDEDHNGGSDVYVAKLDPAGATLTYSTLIGGDAADFPWTIDVDGSGSAYVAGTTGNGTVDFPTTTGAYDGDQNGNNDGFVAKITAAGDDLVYSTFLGGTSQDRGLGIAVDGTGAAYFSGWTSSEDYPTSPGSFDTEPNGNIDAVVTKLNASGSDLVYSTFLGGSGVDTAQRIAVDPAGSAHVTGGTIDDVTDLPTTAGATDESHNGGEDAYLAILDPAGASLSFATFLGGSGLDRGHAVAVDASGGTYAVGRTTDAATDLSTTAGAFDQTHNGDVDAFVAKFQGPQPLPAATCRGKTATIVGTDAGETIAGTGGKDVVAALGGNDRVKGLGGADLVCAGSGNDRANGAGGKDRLYGEAGKDRLNGGGAKDRLKGGGGKDRCVGGGGKDRATCEKERKVP